MEDLRKQVEKLTTQVYWLDKEMSEWRAFRNLRVVALKDELNLLSEMS